MFFAFLELSTQSSGLVLENIDQGDYEPLTSEVPALRWQAHIGSERLAYLKLLTAALALS